MSYTGSLQHIIEEELGMGTSQYTELFKELEFRYITATTGSLLPYCKICEGCGKPFTPKHKNFRTKFLCKNCSRLNYNTYMQGYKKRHPRLDSIYR